MEQGLTQGESAAGRKKPAEKKSHQFSISTKDVKHHEAKPDKKNEYLREENAMIFKATTLIRQEFDAKNLKNLVQERDEVSSLNAGFAVKNGPGLEVKFISYDDSNTVAIRLFALVRVSDEDRAKVYDVINTANTNFRYVRFYIDKEGDVNMGYDLPQTTPDNLVGPMCVEMFVRFVDVINKVYPDFMRALWS